MGFLSDRFSQTFRSRVAGVSFAIDDGVSRQDLLQQCYAGEALQLVRERNNPHSETGTAVAVHRLSGEKLGYMPSGDIRLARHMDQGGRVEARIVAITGGPGLLGWLLPALRRHYGCVIEVTKYDPDWSALEPWLRENRAIDDLIKAAQKKERSNPEEALRAYREAVRRIKALDAAGQQAAATRTVRYPIDRLSLVLDRLGRPHEALAEIETYETLSDSCG
jgi:hypothetical protein